MQLIRGLSSYTISTFILYKLQAAIKTADNKKLVGCFGIPITGQGENACNR